MQIYECVVLDDCQSVLNLAKSVWLSTASRWYKECHAKGYNLEGCCRASGGMIMSSKNPRDTETETTHTHWTHGRTDQPTTTSKLTISTVNNNYILITKRNANVSRSFYSHTKHLPILSRQHDAARCDFLIKSSNICWHVPCSCTHCNSMIWMCIWDAHVKKKQVMNDIYFWRSHTTSSV